MDYPFSLYKPSERFVKLSETELAHQMWACVSRQESVDKMILAITEGKPAVTNMDEELHTRFSDLIIAHHEDEDELRVLCMNMMKQLLEYLGYEHTSCALCGEGQFVKSAGLFTKKEI